MLRRKKIVLGVTGGIAAYKTVTLARRLTETGADVTVIMTEAATKFVGPLTFAAVTGHPVITSLFETGTADPIGHIAVTETAELIVVAPATADFIAKTACGLADDALSAIVLAAGCPVLMAPAMNTRMLKNPATQANLRTIRERGIRTIGPAEGALAEGWGLGRMADESEIINVVLALVKERQTLKGKRVIVTAGGTQEAIDPVRYLGNRSTGKMGYALAEAAAARGARVILISAPTELARPADVEFIPVVSAEEMRKAVLNRYPKADIVIMTAAVADLKADASAAGKIKKENLKSVKLEPTPDILSELGKKKKKGQFLVGFSAESSDLIKNAQAKLEKKKLDLIIANDISRPDIGFGSDYNQVTIVAADGRIKDTPRVKKSELAALILDEFPAGS
ncbi:MAG: bifunctional phosphopantothenoylcysteine decarboxylase/phosphopantothenate--cysteine ligase CoaBC [Actinomycetota bacterium]